MATGLLFSLALFFGILCSLFSDFYYSSEFGALHLWRLMNTVPVSSLGASFSRVYMSVNGRRWDQNQREDLPSVCNNSCVCVYVVLKRWKKNMKVRESCEKSSEHMLICLPPSTTFLENCTSFSLRSVTLPERKILKNFWVKRRKKKSEVKQAQAFLNGKFSYY